MESLFKTPSQRLDSLSSDSRNAIRQFQESAATARNMQTTNHDVTAVTDASLMDPQPARISVLAAQRLGMLPQIPPFSARLLARLQDLSPLPVGSTPRPAWLFNPLLNTWTQSIFPSPVVPHSDSTNHSGLRRTRSETTSMLSSCSEKNVLKRTKTIPSPKQSAIILFDYGNLSPPQSPQTLFASFLLKAASDCAITGKHRWSHWCARLNIPNPEKLLEAPVKNLPLLASPHAQLHYATAVLYMEAISSQGGAHSNPCRS
mmetsp:Transcript_37992/g.64663  ORF Transcript_37992/g.64663 Transcript_37992/m.64663 type:complete len:260 (-) Transcript_37992:17-796(-)